MAKKLKATLLDFIGKYNLNGTVEAVKWTASGNELKTDIVAEDKTLIGTIIKEGVEVPDMEVGIYNTTNFVKILSVFEDLDIAVGMNQLKTPSHFELTGGDIKAKFNLAALDVIPTPAVPKNMPSFGLTLDVTKELINKINTAKSALPDISHITFNVKAGEPEVIIGYSKNNTTNISFPATGQVDGEVAYKSFNSNYLVEIFKANKDFKTAIMEISGAGLMHVAFIGDDYKSEYYLVEVNHI